MVCNKAMKEALDDIIQGIDFTYKMDDIISNLPKNQKFNAQQLRGYLTKKGVSPKEIEASGILEPYLNDSRAFTAEEWEIMSSEEGKHRFEKEALEGSNYPEITLGRKGEDNPTYQEKLFTAPPVKESTNLSHLSSDVPKGKSLLGWNRIHLDKINGKNTTVLNEFQSDWLQAERQGAGSFESNIQRNKEKLKETEILLNNAKDSFNRINMEVSELYEQFRLKYGGNAIKEAEKDARYIKLADEYEAAQELVSELEKEQIRYKKLTRTTIADFPMKPEKFHQLMIVDAINEAIENGTKRVAIPIERENELVGTEGVTKFYDSLNKSILPDIRKKLEKQGLRIKLSKEDYTEGLSKAEQLEGSALFNEEIDKILGKGKATELLYVAPNNAPHMKFMVDNPIEKLKSLNIPELKDFLYGTSKSNTLHIIEIEEIPNKRVKWDVYAVLAALGLEKYVNKEEN